MTKPFNYLIFTTPQGVHPTALPSGNRTIEHIKQGLPKSAFDLESPYFMPFSAVSTPEKAFSIVSKSAGI
ncbi:MULTISPECIES: hypothetical protein [unclassified Clostridium]|uniref:hypothetical protein n=1 Tax=unclassified Clostridium TaxID=2614128 RepID=UPI001A9AFA25|nr:MULTISPECIES: hypothetical protein [unclassified Clostridium]